MNWYTSLERFKALVEVKGDDKNAAIANVIEAASRKIDQVLGRRFIPFKDTRYYDYKPAGENDDTERYYIRLAWSRQAQNLDEDLISVDTNGITTANATVTIADADIILQPQNEGPPFSRIDLLATGTSFFQAGTTPQKATAITGLWGYGNDTETGGTVGSGLASSAAATTFICANASQIDVGDTLLIGTEQLFVSGRTFDTSGATLTNGPITASIASRTMTLDVTLAAGEVILIDSERMYIDSVSGFDHTVIRAWDGSTLATHADDTAVDVNRTLTVVRGVNGTTAATHANGAAISKYRVPGLISALCLSEAILQFNQDQGGQTGIIAGGEGGIGITPKALQSQWEAVKRTYMRPLSRVL